MTEPNFILICSVCRKEISDKVGKRYCNCEREEFTKDDCSVNDKNPFEGEDILDFLMGFRRKK